MFRPCFGLPSVRKTWPVRQWIDPEMYRFSLLPGVSTLACSPLIIHIEPILGLVLMSTSSWKTAVSSAGRLGQELAEGVEPGLALGVLRPEDRAWPAVDQVAAMQPAADGLAADLDVVDAEHQEDDGLAAPAAAEEAEVAGRVLGDPLDDDVDPAGGEAKGAAGLVPGDPLDALGVEPLDPSVDGPAAAEQERGDGGPGVPVVQEQEDMGSEADLGVVVLAIAIEECGPLLGVEVDAAFHGCVGVSSDGLILPFYDPETLSGLRGAIRRVGEKSEGLY